MTRLQRLIFRTNTIPKDGSSTVIPTLNALCPILTTLIIYHHDLEVKVPQGYENSDFLDLFTPLTFLSDTQPIAEAWIFPTLCDLRIYRGNSFHRFGPSKMGSLLKFLSLNRRIQHLAIPPPFIFRKHAEGSYPSAGEIYRNIQTFSINFLDRDPPPDYQRITRSFPSLKQLILDFVSGFHSRQHCQ